VKKASDVNRLGCLKGQNILKATGEVNLEGAQVGIIEAHGELAPLTE